MTQANKNNSADIKTPHKNAPETEIYYENFMENFHREILKQLNYACQKYLLIMEKSEIFSRWTNTNKIKKQAQKQDSLNNLKFRKKLYGPKTLWKLNTKNFWKKYSKNIPNGTYFCLKKVLKLLQNSIISGRRHRNQEHSKTLNLAQ